MLSSVRKHALGGTPPAPKKPKAYRESHDQREVVKWIRARPDWLVMRMENAAKRTGAQYARDEALGMEGGAPDLVVFFRRWAFFLEIKEVNGRVSDVQLKLHSELRQRGSCVMVGWGHARTIEALEKIEVYRSHHHDDDKTFFACMQSTIERASTK